MRARSFYSIRGGRAAALASTAVAVVLGLSSPAPAQYPNAGPTSQSDRPPPGISVFRPRFSADAAMQPGEGGSPEVRIDFRFSREELLFERNPKGFRAAYAFRVIFRTAKGNRQVAGDHLTREIIVATYAEAYRQRPDVLDHAMFRVPPGRYVIEISMTDLSAENLSSTELEFEVPPLPAWQVWFTDLSLGTVPEDSASGGATHPAMDLNPSRRYAANITRFAAACEIVDNRAGSDSSYGIRYSILGSLPQPVVQGDSTVLRTGSRTRVLMRPSLGPLEAGVYRFVIEMVSPLPPSTGKKKVSPIQQEKSFTVEQSSANIWADPRGSIDLLRYIASEQELNEMGGLRTPEQQKEFWEAFWKRRDQNPETPENERMDEFYKRVQYANQHFGFGRAGWKSDMGRIYIVNGEPDEVVRNPFNVDRPPEEIWYYYRDRKTFVFIDRDGFGRYDLDASRTNQP